MRRPVTVVILCWNRWALTERCLATLKENTRPTGVTVLAVDNGSTDETPTRLRSYEWLRVVTLPSNLGFARGNNAGISAADPEADVVLLNNDVEVLQAGWLEALQAAAHAAPDVGIAGCRLAGPDGTLCHAGADLVPDTCGGSETGWGERDVNQYARTRDVPAVGFACAYIRREVLTAIGGLSEEFTSYFEDSDYCLRARDAGFRIVCCGAVTLVHREHGSTSDDPVFFGRLYRESQAVFRKRWQAALLGRYRHRLTWQSILNIPTGYAISSRELLKALDAAGVHMSYEYVYGRGTPHPFPEDDRSGDYRLDVLMRRSAAGRPAVSVVYAQGDVFRKNRGRFRIGFTMLETDGFPATWVRQSNAMDEVWTPSGFNRDGLLASGVKRPVHVIPLGVDPDHFHPAIRGVPNPNGDFVFLSNFEWNERKAPRLLLTVFNRTFRAAEPVLLVCKVLNRNPDVHVSEEIRLLHLKSTGGRIAFLHNRELPYSELGALYRSADAYVSVSRGEGWNLPLMEALACGLPAIATDWGAHTVFVKEDMAYPLRIRGVVPAESSNRNHIGFNWADPDPEHLSHLFRYIFENRDEAREKGTRAAAEMAARWTWRHSAGRITARLVEIGA